MEGKCRGEKGIGTALRSFPSFGDRQREVKGGALAFDTLRPDPTTVGLDQVLGDGEAEAGAAVGA